MKWIKFIIFCCIIFMISCRKDDLLPQPPSVKGVDIFTLKESTISDGNELMFKLDEPGTYVLKLVHRESGQVLSKEKIVGKVGENNINIYTKSLPTKYLYLVLEDVTKKEIKKTALNVN